MSISAKPNQSPAKNVDILISNKDSSSEKHPVSLQVQENHLTSPSLSSTVESVDTSIKNSGPNKLKTWMNKFFSGLQDEIY